MWRLFGSGSLVSHAEGGQVYADRLVEVAAEAGGEEVLADWVAKLIQGTMSRVSARSILA